MNPNQLLSGIRSFGNEVTFGALPYIAAAPMVGANRLLGGNMSYSDALAATQGVLQRDAELNPVATGAGQVLAMAAPGGIVKKGAKKSLNELNQQLLQQDLRHSPVGSVNFDHSVKVALNNLDDDQIKQLTKQLPPEKAKALLKAWTSNKLSVKSIDDQQADVLSRAISLRDEHDAASRAMTADAIAPMERLYGAERLPQVEADFILRGGMPKPVAADTARHFEMNALAGAEARRLLLNGATPSQAAQAIAERFGTSDNKVVEALMQLEQSQISKVQRQQNLARLKGVK